MNKAVKGFGYLLAANVQAIAILIFSWLVGKWLDENYRQEFSWMIVTVAIGFIIIAYTFFMIMKAIVKLDKEKD